MAITVSVKPNSRTEEVVGRDNNYAVKVKEPPVEGKANRAVIRLLAKHLGVAESQIRIVKGFTSRTKIIEIA